MCHTYRVKMAEHEETKELVALKILKSSDDLKDIAKEIQTLSKLKHPHITNLLGYDINASYIKKDGKKLERPVIVMDLAERGTLFDFLKASNSLNKKGFPEPVARRYFQQLITAIEYCHANKVVHRDLKPENILLDSKYNLKVADFGWATIADKQKHITQAGTDR